MNDSTMRRLQIPTLPMLLGSHCVLCVIAQRADGGEIPPSRGNGPVMWTEDGPCRTPGHSAFRFDMRVPDGRIGSCQAQERMQELIHEPQANNRNATMSPAGSPPTATSVQLSPPLGDPAHWMRVLDTFRNTRRFLGIFHPGYDLERDCSLGFDWFVMAESVTTVSSHEKAVDPFSAISKRV